MAEDPAGDVASALARADAAYLPVREFEAWVPGGFDLTAWDEAKRSLDERRAAADPAEVRAALQERLRAAAVDTGAIEGLYDTDRGFTLSVAQQAISLDQAEVEKGPGFRRNYEAQLEGFEMALDIATGAAPISESLIRQLHQVTCAGQPTYRVITPVGVQELELVLGTYKTHPNHVQLGDGSFHAYAPVAEVAVEMHRLVDQLSSDAFQAAHPVLQAAYAHHAFTAIHPFPDGNGRVARLLASIWLLRAASIPLWIELSDRPRYFDALAGADLGHTEVLVRFVVEGSLALLRELGLGLEFAKEAAPASRDPEPAAMREAVRALGRFISDRLADDGDVELLEQGLSLGPDRGFAGLVGSIYLHSYERQPERRFTISRRTAAPSTDRFVVISAASGDLSAPDIVEPFAAPDFVPVVSESAARRLTLLASVIVRRAMGEGVPAG